MRKILFVLFWGMGATLFAKDYALIITIGNYKHTTLLSGSHQDNLAYRAILKKWGVNNIVSLEDAQATRKNILYHLSSIAQKLKKDDRFYMFFSGHGSSLYDELYSAKFQQAGLTQLLKDSGAILPYDFDPKHISQTVLIGKRDLRPHLEEIDSKVAHGIIIFDACYSEQSIRDGNTQKSINRTPNILTISDDYPYKHIIYIASSITEAKSGKFSSILKSCLSQKFVLQSVKSCINGKMDKSFQIPVILSY